MAFRLYASVKVKAHQQYYKIAENNIITIAKNELTRPEINNAIIGKIGGVFLTIFTIRAIMAKINPKKGINAIGNDNIPRNQANFEMPFASVLYVRYCSL